ncbi:MAG: dihydrodipicolinate reductase [Ilumatobacteraceae bacterium]|nr:dihydrodipicolinate reductase [Ilumatobacteraceae bacterium]
MTLRVVQWTTGKTGSAAVRSMIGHPVLELVGCYAFSPDKAGHDVGSLCGMEPIGVVATDDIDALLALRPDCVAYMPYRPDIDDVVRILEAGVNVVTTLYMLAGSGYGPEATARIAAAAAVGNATLYASGIYPGHAPMVALAASAMCARIDRITVLESLDMSGYANEPMFRAMGIDLSPDDPAARAAVEASCGSFRDQLAVLAHALEVTLDDIDIAVEFAVADETTDVGGMTIRQGHIGGFRGAVRGLVGGEPRLECQFVWKMGEHLTPNWPVTHGYIIEIFGEPDVRCRLEPMGDHFDGALGTAMAVVNAIPAVCAAPAGVLNLLELPLVRGVHRMRGPVD